MLRVVLFILFINVFFTRHVQALSVFVFPNASQTQQEPAYTEKRACPTKYKSPQTTQHDQKQIKKLQALYKTNLYGTFYQVLNARGFPKSAIPKLFCVAYLESGFNTKAKNSNKNGTVDVGLFQINSQWTGRCGDPGRSLAANLDCAKVVLNSQGLSAWTTYKTQGWVCEESLKHV